MLRKLWWVCRWILIAYAFWRLTEQAPEWIWLLITIWWLYPGPSPFDKEGNRNAV